MRMLILFFLLLFSGAGNAFAELKVVATLPWIGNLVKEIGRDKIDVTTLVKPGQNPHMVEAKPSMILAGRKADILMYNGLDLEIGYLPLILESARNPGIVSGRAGNFDCSQFVEVIEKPATVDRSMGDVHPLGNPHYHFSPTNILRVAEGMSVALAQLDKANEEFFRESFKTFAAKLEQRRIKWQSSGPEGRKYVAYHRYFEYLAREYGFQLIGYVEPKPGIPPSAAHVERLIVTIKTTMPDGILVTPAYGLKEAESLAAKTGVKVVVLPHDVGSMEGTEDWFAFMDTTMAAFK